MSVRLTCLVALILLPSLTGWAFAQDDRSRVSFTDADRISRLQQTVEDEQNHLVDLQRQIDNPDSEFIRAGEKFRSLDKEIEALRTRSKQLKSEEKFEEFNKLAEEIVCLEEELEAARVRFNQAINHRKAMQRSMELVQKSLERHQNELDHLTGEEKAEPTPKQSAEAPKSQDPPGNSKSKPSEPIRNSMNVNVVPGAPMPLPDGTMTPSTVDSETRQDPPSRAYLRAAEMARQKEAIALRAERRAQSLTKQIDEMKAVIARGEELMQLDQKMLEATDAENERRTLKERLVQRTTDLVNWRRTLESLQEQEKQIQNDLERASEEAEQSRTEMERLSSPYAWENLGEWAERALPRVGMIVMIMLVLRFLAHRFSGRLVRILAVNSTTRATEEDRANRAQTLQGVFGSTISLLIIGGGAMMILDELGIPVVPLIGGAAVLGLAVAFGAQNLIKDYFAGIMVLLEDQYGLKDVVRIGSTSGQVEKITLRMTVLRDIEGIVHFIPHGQLTTVSNMTHGWSRALLNVGVSYKEDVNRVMEVLVELGRELRYDRKFGPLILEDPEMLGVDKFGESEVVIAFFIKTCPLQQWKVRRELNRRIKERFDELGIEIPFPHRTLFVRTPIQTLSHHDAVEDEPVTEKPPLKHDAA